MQWTVVLTKRTAKEIGKVPHSVAERAAVLMREIECYGPVRGNWPNYGKLADGTHHCHLKKGRPTYVICWRELRQTIVVEVYYVGTHENAPY